MSSSRSSSASEAISDVDCTLMTLRKPTELRKVINSIPKPGRSVPKNGLPLWYKLGLECKLPVPKIPIGKIIFSRGKIGEDVRRLGLEGEGPQPSFDLTDPYCRNVSYEYIPEHDPHLANYFAQKAARTRMKDLGFVTKDGRAVCSLKDFNQYRKYLYNQFMDRIHVEIKKLDERARDDLTLKMVDRDVERRHLRFIKSERAREHLERAAQEHADEFAERKRMAKERDKIIQQRMKYLSEFKEQQRLHHAAKGREKETRIKQRVQAAAELELRRKIMLVRSWKVNERKRLNRLKHEKAQKQAALEKQANDKWIQRIDSQNQKILKEEMLLKLYSEDMAAAAMRRAKKSEIQAYNQYMEVHRLRLANWKLGHGGKAKERNLVKKMGVEFEKSKRGAKGMSPELAQALAEEAMSQALSTEGDALMILGQARAKMDQETILPSPVLRMIDEMLEATINEFARRRVTILLRHIERVIRHRAAEVFFANIRQLTKKRAPKERRWKGQAACELEKQHDERQTVVAFGSVRNIQPEDSTEIDMKSIKARTPTPMPSKMLLAEVTFCDRVEDLPDPVPRPGDLIERKKLLEMINRAAKILFRSVSEKVHLGMDVIIGNVTLPRIRHAMEWGEAVEGLANAAVESRVSNECSDVRRASVFLAHRILRSLLAEMKEEKKRLKCMQPPSDDEVKDFYDPNAVAISEVSDQGDGDSTRNDAK